MGLVFNILGLMLVNHCFNRFCVGFFSFFTLLFPLALLLHFTAF